MLRIAEKKRRILERELGFCLISILYRFQASARARNTEIVMDNSGHNGRSTQGGRDKHTDFSISKAFSEKGTQYIYRIYKAASLEIVARETNCEILRGEEGSVEVRVSPGLSQFTFREGNTQQSENVLRNKNMILRFSLSALLYFVGREYLLTPKRAFS